MTTLLVTTTPDELRHLCLWADALAASQDSELTLLLPMRRKGETRLTAAATTAEPDESELLTAAREVLANSANESSDDDLPIRILAGEEWQTGIADALLELKPSLVIVPASTISKEHSNDDDWQTQLLQAVECDVLMLRDDSERVLTGMNLAIFVNDSTDNETALKYSSVLAMSIDGTATAVYVQPNISSEAAAIGRRRLENILQRTLGRTGREQLTPRVIVARTLHDGLQNFDAAEFDIVLMGSRELRQTRQFLGTDFGKNEEESDAMPAVGIFRRGDSFSHRILSHVDRRISEVVPQLSREERIDLATRIQESSNWDFDFVLMISLATLIACFGLAQNSGAVIVGAMLVAPLMTPIAGVGMGVAHANLLLTKVAFRTAIRGFATAIFIGAVFALVVQAGSWLGWLEPLLQQSAPRNEPHLRFPSEMENRMHPHFYDLLIALASGIAAAYAMGRPNLFSALPGVAIAAALVPPIATSGIALAHGNIIKGSGALLLFVTNMVVIILGTSLVFRAVGVKSQKEGPHAAKWPRYVLLLLVILSVIVTIAIEIHRQQR